MVWFELPNAPVNEASSQRSRVLVPFDATS